MIHETRLILTAFSPVCCRLLLYVPWSPLMPSNCPSVCRMRIKCVINIIEVICSGERNTVYISQHLATRRCLSPLTASCIQNVMKLHYNRPTYASSVSVWGYYNVDGVGLTLNRRAAAVRSPFPHSVDY